MKAIKIIAVVLAICIAVPSIAVFIAYRHFTGEDGEANTLAALDRAWESSVDPAVKTQVIQNEETVLETLALIQDAQTSHKQAHGRYAQQLAELELPTELMLAELGSNSMHGYLGYRFGPVPLDGALENNWVHRWAICAIPAGYRVTGIRTYAVDSDGALYRSDNWGTAVENTVEFLDGSWESLPETGPRG